MESAENFEKPSEASEHTQEINTDIDDAADRSRNKGIGMEKIRTGLMVAILLITAFNTYQISQIMGTEGKVASKSSPTAVDAESECTSPDRATHGSTPIVLDVLPKGIPQIYGEELGVGYGDISSATPQKADITIKKLGILDQRINLTNDELKRYIAVASQISCEYCCGVESIIFNNGKPACSCAHSFAMRGLAKYLIKYHGSEFTNDEILEELGKWKVLFFPSQAAEKAKILQEKGIELNYFNLASNKYKGVEKGASGEMVGKC